MSDLNRIAKAISLATHRVNNLQRWRITGGRIPISTTVSDRRGQTPNVLSVPWQMDGYTSRTRAGAPRR
jgi:hypothetical protein